MGSKCQENGSTHCLQKYRIAADTAKMYLQQTCGKIDPFLLETKLFCQKCLSAKCGKSWVQLVSKSWRGAFKSGGNAPNTAATF